MDGILLTLRWQNILSVWIMVIALALTVVLLTQVSRRVFGGGDGAS